MTPICNPVSGRLHRLPHFKTSGACAAWSLAWCPWRSTHKQIGDLVCEIRIIFFLSIKVASVTLNCICHFVAQGCNIKISSCKTSRLASF